jgi:hypothetical protein
MQIFDRATKHISHSKFPTLENSIPIYNWLMDEIEIFQENRIINKEIKEAALKAMEKLKKYYSSTDALPYTIATSMYKYYFYFYFFLLFFFIFNN